MVVAGILVGLVLVTPVLIVVAWGLVTGELIVVPPTVVPAVTL